MLDSYKKSKIFPIAMKYNALVTNKGFRSASLLPNCKYLFCKKDNIKDKTIVENKKINKNPFNCGYKSDQPI
jgi:hypothetical protein